MIQLRAGGATDVGRVRAKNQDAWQTTDRLFAVADGMGGHQGGEVAAQLAVDVLISEAAELTAESLVTAAHRANAAIFAEAEERSDLRGMGTTLCAVALVDDSGDDELAVINVGDSRCYLLSGEELTQVTRDHSLVEDMRASGQITAAEAAVHPHRNIVTRALGISPTVEIDEFIVLPKTGDRLVLCSDGLFNEVKAEVIAATLGEISDPTEAANELVRLANEGGGHDNITCVVVDVLDDGGRAERAAAAGIAAIRSRGNRAGSADEGRSDGGDAKDSTRVFDRVNSERSRDQITITDDPAPAKLEGKHAKAKKSDEKKSKPKKSAAKDSKAPTPRLRRATWRTAVFVLVFAAILAAAGGAVAWYSRGTYYIGFDATDQVAVYKGRPDPVLWFKPTVERRTGIAKAQVPQLNVDAITKGKEVGSLPGADAYLEEMRTMICSNLRNGAKPPKAPASAPTTTIPASCAKEFAVKKPSKSTTTTTSTKPPTTTVAAAATSVVAPPAP